MAKKTDTPTALAERPSVSEALAVADTVDVNDHRGKENISQDDIKVPRLAIAQKTSDQIEPGKDKYIDGLRLFEMFNTMTGEIYGSGPVQFAIVSYDKNAVEFDADLKVVERNVPLTDPRCAFGANGEKPVATVFHQYLVVLIPSGEIVQLSIKGTSISAAKDINGYQTLRKGPAWAGSYSITTTSKVTGPYTVGIFKAKPAGKTPDDIVAQAEAVYQLLQAGKIKTDDPAADETPSADDAVPF